jgi:hypothetical protein
MSNLPPGFTVRSRPVISARVLDERLPPPLRAYLERAEAAVAEPFRGITAGGAPVSGLFPLRRTGVSTAPIRDAAAAFLASLGAPLRARASFPVESDAWRRWSNIHPFIMRHGVSLDEMTGPQREAALALLRATLSATGFATARDVMRLNEVIREITGRDEEYGEWLYWLSVMGTPSDDAPWGWQLDGHHLIVNCFVLGDQVVTTPLFMGSEPVAATSGPHAGTRVFQAEERDGLALVRALDPEQRRQAVLGAELPGEVFTAAFRDNFELRYEGIRYEDLAPVQRDQLGALLELYVGRERPGHAAIRMAEVARRLPETWFAWMGGTDEDSVFYYRVHSPVILVEFDHQRGIALANDAPSRQHIHTVVRTPNGGDYGVDLLRQHHARHHRRPA